MGSLRSFSRSGTSILGVGLVGILGAWTYSKYVKANEFAGTENYAIVYPTSLPAWKTMPKSPESLFIFKDQKDDFLLRGSVSQVISDVNPTPELNTNGIAQYYIDRTHENMTGWTAQRSPDLPGANIDFSVITRQQKKHTVITAFAVKGNTTLLVSISAQQATQGVVNRAMASLASCLKMISFKLTDMGGGLKAAQEAEASQKPVS